MTERRPLAALLLAVALLPACVTAAYGVPIEEPDDALGVDVTSEIEALASSLGELAELRIALGSARVVLDELVPRRGEGPRFRQASMEARDLEATAATLRFELEMALANRVNLVGAAGLPGAVPADDLADRMRATRATHAIQGTFVRSRDSVEVSLRLVDVEADWIVATARRRIDGFAPDPFLSVVPRGAPRRETGQAGVERSAEDPRRDPFDVGGDPSANLSRTAESLRTDAGQVPGDPGAIPDDAEILFEAGPAASRLGVSPQGSPPADGSGSRPQD